MKKVVDHCISFLFGLLSSGGCIVAYVTVFLGTGSWGKTNGKTPILLVHGYMSHGTHWIYHRYRLRNGDVGPVYTIHLGTPFHTIETYAKRVAKKAQQIAKETGREDLILVGHSMGGVVSAQYALEMAPKGSVRAIVALSSPWKGSRLAKWAFGPSAKQLRIGSPFLEGIVAKLMDEKDLSMYQMATETDLIISPYTSALFPMECIKQTTYRRLSHVQFLFSKDVSNKLISYISTKQISIKC